MKYQRPQTRGRRLRSSTGLIFGLTIGLAAAVVVTGISRGERRSAPEPPSVAADRTAPDLPVFSDWVTFTEADGLPSNKVFCIRATDTRIWAGTNKGLAYFEDGAWRRIGVGDGLPHAAVLSLDVSPQTGDLWIGTMGGLARWSAGRIDAFTQNDSGLPNDFVNAVECDSAEPHVWAATAMGLARFDVGAGTWDIYTEENTPMREPWIYSVSIDRDLLYVGAWGAGILELDKSRNRWREYRDPDGEMEIDLLPDDGPVHDVTAGVLFREGVLWQATYFGAARYDGRLWKSYFKEDSGLASNFINAVRGGLGLAWFCTDQGLSATDGLRWLTYRRGETGRGELLHRNGAEPVRREPTDSIFSHDFVLDADFRGEEIWLATAAGVSRGRLKTVRGRPGIGAAELRRGGDKP